MKEYGIPASITLAQGLLESNAGDSRLAKDANNHFGIKCFSKSCGKDIAKTTRTTLTKTFLEYTQTSGKATEHTRFFCSVAVTNTYQN